MGSQVDVVLTFKNSLGKDVSYTINNCPSNITGAEVKPVMESFISTNVMEGNGADLVEIVGAVVVTKTEKELKLV